MNADVVILAGGMGTRLQSVVADRPKCLADVNGKPFLYYLLKYLSTFKPHNIILSVGYKKELVHDFIATVKDEFDMNFLFAEENEPLGTGGAIKHSLEKITTSDFFILNGDTFFDIDLEKLLSFQKSKMADVSVALKPMNNSSRYGLVELDEQDNIVSFKEKQEGSSGLINGGVYCVFKSAFESIPFPLKFSFEKDFLESFIYERNFYGMISNTYFIDIGIPEDYSRVQIDFLREVSS